MKFFAAVLAFAAMAMAQDFGSLPACARGCFADNLGNSGCAPHDQACICRSKPYNAAVTGCVLGACQPADVIAARQKAVERCAAVGAPLK